MQFSAQFLTVVFVSQQFLTNLLFCQQRKFRRNIRLLRALSKLSNLCVVEGEGGGLQLPIGLKKKEVKTRFQPLTCLRSLLAAIGSLTV